MKKLTSAEVRRLFLDFWQTKGHVVEPSASLVPVDDPTLLWINSGVATLKKYFDGSETPANPRITNSQKSIRTNDIENVGVTARHHTLFEMLGNFSIGDYFKEEAIPWAWEFLTSPEWLDFDPELLYVTYYPEDEETKLIWLNKVGLPEDHLIAEAGNFWDIGAGPCGPDSEIFYDRGEDYQNLPDEDPEMYPGGENERYLEIWNLVFSQFNHMPDDTYQPLPSKNVDTGMGLERVVSIIQDAPTNFETDLFMPIIRELETLAKIGYGVDAKTDISYKVIADHVRAVSFAIGDKALPSNEGRGYILRRLIRRSVMHGRKLGIVKPFLKDLVPIVGHIMESYYPEVNENKDFIQKVIETEEVRFHETIGEGEEILNSIFETMKASGNHVVSGPDAFKLYDTYGFPLELTEEYAEENHYSVDKDGFDAAMKEQQDRARAARKANSSMNVQSPLLGEIDVESDFVGYDATEITGRLLVAVQNESFVETVEADNEAQLVFNLTPFYAEMGGQVADKGFIFDQSGQIVAEVDHVAKAPNGQYLHHVITRQALHLDDTYLLQVDQKSRNQIIKNHSATHLLHQALKDVLGSHANQAGSLVTPDHLRFDFTHFGQVTPEELAQMEQIVNQKIWEALPVITIETTIDKAKEMGAMALFGEKYGENVRVVNMGDYSIELCGGIHVSSTEDIGIFKILSEGGIGAGVRRIEAVTSQSAYEALKNSEANLTQLAQALKSPQIADVHIKLANLQAELKELKSENESYKAKLINQESAAIFDNKEELNGLSVIKATTKDKEMQDLRTLADQWKAKQLSNILVLVSAHGEKVSLIVACDQEATANGIKAGDLIKQLAPEIGGGGGGRPDMAQAGGKNPNGIPNLLEKVNTLIV